MTLRDGIVLATGNLWRMKLRAILTITGVVIAIGAFVAMLSFAAGSHGYISNEYQELGLFNTMQVYPGKSSEDDGESKIPTLDMNAVDRFASLSGVNVAYPFDDFSVDAMFGDTLLETRAQALPVAAARTKLFSRVLAGRLFDGDEDREAIVEESFLEMTGTEVADSVIGERIVLAVRKPDVERALFHVLSDESGELGEALSRVVPESLGTADYRRRIMTGTLGGVARRFLEGFLEGGRVERETLIVCGVVRGAGSRSLRTAPILVPAEVARRMSAGTIGTDPAELYAALQSGRLFVGEGGGDGEFPRVTLDLGSRANHDEIGDSIEAMGFEVFSYARQFEEIRRSYLILELGLAVVGLVALVTAALGIVNTMFMSISERRGEIGVLKSLGADEETIRTIFLIESSIIGLLGALFGILLGWIVSRVASIILKIVMEKQGVPPIDVFATPLWLILLAVMIGLGVSLLSGVIPAARAARVDPVVALRSN